MGIKNIVILAGGKNSRFESLSVFPKVILPIGNESILQKLLNVFNTIETIEKVNLIVNQSYKDIVLSYYNNSLYNKDKLNIIFSKNQNGSAYTFCEVSKKLNTKFFIKDNYTLFIWSDLILNENDLREFINELNTVVLKDNTKKFLYITNTLDYRIGVEKDGSIIDYRKHNLPGLYVLGGLENETEYSSIWSFVKKSHKDNYDFSEVFNDLHLLNKFKEVSSYEYRWSIREIRDLGAYELERLNNYNINNMQTRFFNQISFLTKDILVKKCISDKNHYKQLIENEYNWYNYVASIESKNENSVIPKIYEYNKDFNFIKMEYINGETLENTYRKNNSFFNDKKNINDVLYSINMLHSFEIKESDFERYKKDSFKEYVIKTLTRSSSVSHIIMAYDYDKLEELLLEAYDTLISSVSDNDISYRIIHGDLNGSNIMLLNENYNNVSKVKFIDPRGYFGDSKLFGPREYDYAKFLYFLDGYNNFNTKTNFIWYKPGEYTTIDKVVDTNKNVFSDFCSSTEYKRLEIIKDIIWLNLTSYISNDILKVNIAYDYGFESLQKHVKGFKKGD